MPFAVFLLIVGAVVLTVGAEAAIRGAARFGRDHGISPFLLGALLFGMDLESLGAALIAAGKGTTSIAAGEAFGTMVFLLGVGFAAALLLSKRPIDAPRPGMILMPIGCLIAGGLALHDQTVTRAEGLALIALYAAYVYAIVQEGRAVRARAKEIEREADEGFSLPPAALAAGGLVLVFLGATWLVDGGVRILSVTGLSAGFVGAVVIGALAAADEVLLEVIPVRRGITELATGNLLGTVAAFSTGAIGLAALVRPLVVDPAGTLTYLAGAVLYSTVAMVFLARGRAGRALGIVLVLGYGSWIFLTLHV